MNLNNLTKPQAQRLFLETSIILGACVSYASGFMAGLEAKTKRQKKTDEIMALQQELIKVLADGNRDFTMTSDNWFDFVDTKMEFLTMVYREAGYKEI